MQGPKVTPKFAANHRSHGGDLDAADARHARRAPRPRRDAERRGRARLPLHDHVHEPCPAHRTRACTGRIFTFIHKRLCTTARGRSSTTTPSTLAPQPACPPAPAKRARARPCPRPRPHPHPSLARWPWAAAARRRPALAPRRHARAAHACSLDARYGPGPVGEARRPAPVDRLHPPGSGWHGRVGERTHMNVHGTFRCSRLPQQAVSYMTAGRGFPDPTYTTR